MKAYILLGATAIALTLLTNSTTTGKGAANVSETKARIRAAAATMDRG